MTEKQPSRQWGDSLADGMDDAYLIKSIQRFERENEELRDQIRANNRILADLRRQRRKRGKGSSGE